MIGRRIKSPLKTPLLLILTFRHFKWAEVFVYRSFRLIG